MLRGKKIDEDENLVEQFGEDLYTDDDEELLVDEEP